MKTKIQIKSVNGRALFEHECEDNTIKKTVEQAVKGGASLNGANLDGARLNGARLNGASLDGASLDGASLNRASLYGARLNGANLDGANLDGARLNGASLDGASLDGASLYWAKLEDSNGKEFKIVKCAQVLGFRHSVFLFDTHMKIGCKCLPYKEWWKYKPEEELKEEWKTWKPILKKMSEIIYEP